MTLPEGDGLLSRIPGLRPAIAIALALFLVATGTLAGNAYWSAVASKDATASAASIATTSSGANALAVAYKQGFAPGGSIIATSVLDKTAPITITNTGATPLNYTVSVTGGSATVTLQLWKRGASCDESTVAAAGATSGTLSAPPSMPADASSAVAGASVLLCARTSLNGTFDAIVGASITPTITFTGRVGDNWSASSGAAFTQSASYNWFRVKHSASGKCLNATGALPVVGALMVLNTCNASVSQTHNQAFRFEPVGSYYRIYVGNGTSAGPVVAPVLDADGSPVQLVAKTTTAGALLNRQLWTIGAHGVAGDYQILNLQSGSCLTVTSSADFTAFTITKCANSQSPNSNGYQTEHFTFTEIP